MLAKTRGSDIQIEITNDSSLKRVARASIQKAVITTLKCHKKKRANISIVLVGDKAIRKINKQFLNHDYATDVITFALEETEIDGEIYVSVETAAQQAAEYKVSHINEILRLVIHGVLHLIGFDDATPEQRERMHEEENSILDQLAWL